VKPAKPTRLKRRTEAQVALDDAKILEAVKTKAGLRAVTIKKLVKLPSQNIASGLQRLRAAGKVKAKGQRSATTYSAA
jgi:predicted transcriptional regulator